VGFRVLELRSLKCSRKNRFPYLSVPFRGFLRVTVRPPRMSRLRSAASAVADCQPSELYARPHPCLLPHPPTPSSFVILLRHPPSSSSFVILLRRKHYGGQESATEDKGEGGAVGCPLFVVSTFGRRRAATVGGGGTPYRANKCTSVKSSVKCGSHACFKCEIKCVLTGFKCAGDKGESKKWKAGILKR
jgi:hypothetical protein